MYIFDVRSLYVQCKKCVCLMHKHVIRYELVDYSHRIFCSFSLKDDKNQIIPNTLTWLNPFAYKHLSPVTLGC